MSSKDMFAGFKVGSGATRSEKKVTLRGEPYDCKVSGRDTSGAMCALEFTGASSGPLRRHRDQDEWIYVLEGDLKFLAGEKQFQAAPGESVFVPRKTAYGWASMNRGPARIIDVYQPAGRMEEFFRELSRFNSGPPVHEALSIDELRRLFQEHGMDLAGPPIVGEWKVENGRIMHAQS